MSAMLRYLHAFSVLEITLALVCLVEAVPTDEKEEGNAGNSNGGIRTQSIIPLFRPISTSK